MLLWAFFNLLCFWDDGTLALNYSNFVSNILLAICKGGFFLMTKNERHIFCNNHSTNTLCAVNIEIYCGVSLGVRYFNGSLY